MNFLEKGTIRSVNELRENAPYTRFKTGRVTSIGVNGTTVMIDGTIYTDLLRMTGTTLDVDDMVEIVIPNNQDSNMFILGKLTV